MGWKYIKGTEKDFKNAPENAIQWLLYIRVKDELSVPLIPKLEEKSLTFPLNWLVIVDLAPFGIIADGIILALIARVLSNP